MAELLFALVAACMLKSIERMASMLGFSFRGAEVEVRGVRQEKPPKLGRIEYVLTVETDEPDQRLELLHAHVKRHGTVYNTVRGATGLTGEIRRAVRGHYPDGRMPAYFAGPPSSAARSQYRI